MATDLPLPGNALVFHARNPALAHAPRRQRLARWLPALVALPMVGMVVGVLGILSSHAPGGWPQVWPF